MEKPEAGPFLQEDSAAPSCLGAERFAVTLGPPVSHMTLFQFPPLQSELCTHFTLGFSRALMVPSRCPAQGDSLPWAGLKELSVGGPRLGAQSSERLYPCTGSSLCLRRVP
jgi:hypothetical protein